MLGSGKRVLILILRVLLVASGLYLFTRPRLGSFSWLDAHHFWTTIVDFGSGVLLMALAFAFPSKPSKRTRG